MNKRTTAPLLVLLVGIVSASIILVTGKKIEHKPPDVMAPIVGVRTAIPETLQLSVSTHGIVVPRTESELVPEVSGRVIWVAPELVSGGFFAKDDPLLRIEALDYEVALEQGRARLARAESDLANARVAHSRQMDLAARQAASEAQRDNAINRLRVTEAAKREAVAFLGKAERDLERTEIIAPYDGRVRSERIDVGQFVNRGHAMATIYAVDFAEVRLPAHDEELAFLDLPLITNGHTPTDPVQVVLRARFAGKEHEWLGEVVRTEGELDPRTRMVNVVARVADPYATSEHKPPLKVGLFVEAEILGAQAIDVVVLPRVALRGTEHVIVVDDEQRLHFRKVDVLRVGSNEVLIESGLERGEKICISPIDTAMDGMLVRIRDTLPAVAASRESEHHL